MFIFRHRVLQAISIHGKDKEGLIEEHVQHRCMGVYQDLFGNCLIFFFYSLLELVAYKGSRAAPEFEVLPSYFFVQSGISSNPM